MFSHSVDRRRWSTFRVTSLRKQFIKFYVNSTNVWIKYVLTLPLVNLQFPFYLSNFRKSFVLELGCSIYFLGNFTPFYTYILAHSTILYITLSHLRLIRHYSIDHLLFLRIKKSLHKLFYLKSLKNSSKISTFVLCRPFLNAKYLVSRNSLKKKTRKWKENIRWLSLSFYPTYIKKRAQPNRREYNF